MTDDLPEPMDLPDPTITTGWASWVNWLIIVGFAAFLAVVIVLASVAS